MRNSLAQQRPNTKRTRPKPLVPGLRFPEGAGRPRGRGARGAASGGNGFRKGLGVRARGGPCEWEMSGGGRAGGSKVRSAVAVEAERAAPGSVGFPCLSWPGLMGTRGLWRSVWSRAPSPCPPAREPSAWAADGGRNAPLGRDLE